MGGFPGFGVWMNQNTQQPLKVRFISIRAFPGSQIYIITIGQM